MPDLKPKLAERDILTPGRASAGLGVVGMTALIIAALYVGREVFVPVALAILLSFVLSLLFGRSERNGLQTVASFTGRDDLGIDD